MSQGNLRVAVIGIGHMGAAHARAFGEDKIQGATLAAVCDPKPDSMLAFPNAPHFTCASELFERAAIDAVVIATPHYAHTPLAIQALERGLHVLVEKPLGVHKADCEAMLAAYERRPKREQLFAEVFNLRLDPKFSKLRALVRGGELGAIRRIQWTATDWFRSEAYYNSSSWRATWAGEGGGVLMNQAVHNLDLWQWIFGMPARVRAFCGLGRYHAIEVEDEVTAYFEYASGATGVFITSTGEAPGSNRLEVAGDRGKLVVDAAGIAFTRNEQLCSEFVQTSQAIFSAPPVWHAQIPIGAGPPSLQLAILQNFADAASKGTPLVAPAVEGVASVELANAMLLSSLGERTVELPLDSAVYADKLAALRAASRPR